MGNEWGPLRSFLVLAPVLILAVLEAFRQHSSLPEPIRILSDTYPSEQAILDTVSHLASDIGYRIIGTKEHTESVEWLFEQLDALCAEANHGVECEAWKQTGSGSHLFDIMNTRVDKMYTDLTNVLVRLSSSSNPSSKEHAVLVNAHLDSTLPSPGAADDAISVAVMVDIIRVLLNMAKEGWTPEWSIVFLFNGAEECLQDGSHLFSTQDPVAKTVRAVINLEAAGTASREILFQATSEEMIDAYKHVPRPFGTIFANDIFATNLLQSDTDFKVFQEYMNVTGLDMALIGKGYLYHTRNDVVENIEAGAAQNMADNSLALLLHLSSPSSPLPVLHSKGYVPPTTTFYSHLGVFWVYTFRTALVLHLFVLLASLAVVKSGVGQLAKGVLANVLGVIGAVIGSNVTALVMTRVLGKNMSWFGRGELGPIGLFSVPAILGALSTQLFLPRVSERAAIESVLVIQALLAFGIQLFVKIGSAALFFITSTPLLLALAVNRTNRVKLWVYATGGFVPLMTACLVYLPSAQVFVPLMGRAGAVPADHVIGTFVALVGSLGLSLTTAFIHRFSATKNGSLKKAIVVLLGISAVIVGIYARLDAFTPERRRRVFIERVWNITDQTESIHMASSDSAPGFPELVSSVAEFFGAGAEGYEKLEMNEDSADWDILFPFSLALSPWKVPLNDATSAPFKFEGDFGIVVLEDAKKDDERRVKIQVNHEGIIWSVISFSAHVTSWSLSQAPAGGFTRHHVREASPYGSRSWELELTIVGAEDDLSINFIGIREDGNYPHRRTGLAKDMWEAFDGFLNEKTRGAVDGTLLGVVAGVATI